MKNQILLGSLLGDAFIGKLSSRAKSYSIKWEHSLEQEEYALWKAENSLDNYSVYKRERLDKRTNKLYKSIVCSSTKDDYKYYRELFYKDKKEVSLKILNELNSLGITIWYLDDGNIYYNGNNCHLTLAVNGFSNFSKDLIIQWFKDNYDINFKLTGKAIRLTSKKDCLKFMKIIEPNIIESMKYKLLSEAELKHESKLDKTQLKMRKSKLKMYEER